MTSIHSVLRRILFCGVSLLPFSPASAAEDAGDAVFSLGQITVTAETLGAEASGPMTNTVDRATMETFDRTTVDEALKLLPGVKQTYFGPRNEAGMGVRGFGRRDTPVMVDGIPIYVPYDGYVDLGRFTTYDLSEIQVSKGYVSALQGPNTMGGAINLVTRKPVKEIEGEAMAGLRFDGGGLAQHEAAVSAGTNQGLWYGIFSGSWLNSDHVSVSDNFTANANENGGYRDNSYKRDGKLNLKLAYTPDSGDEYALNYIYQHGEKGTPTYAGTDPAVASRYWRWPYWDKQSLYWLSRTGLAGGRGYVKTRVFYDLFENSLNAYDDATYTTQVKKSSFRSFYDDYTLGGSVEAGYDIVPWDTVQAAAHYKYDSHREHDEGEPERAFADRTTSYALENTLRPHRDVDVITGVSLDRRESLKAEDYVGGQIVPFNRDDNQAVNLMGTVLWRYSDEGSTHLSVSRRSRFPTIKDRYSYRFGKALPNPSLDQEQALHYEVGVKQAVTPDVTVDAALFRIDVSDTILAVDLTPNLTQNQNVGDSYSQGVELGVRAFATDTLELGGNYTYLDSENETDPTIKMRDAARHDAFVYADWAVADDVRLVPNLEYTSSRYVDSTGTRAGGFVVANMSAFWQVTDAFRLEAGSSNLTDSDYELSDGYPSPGRAFFLKGRFRY